MLVPGFACDSPVAPGVLFFDCLISGYRLIWGYRPPVWRWYGIESSMTALSGEPALLVPGYACISAVAPGDLFFDRLISGYRLIWGYRPPVWRWCGIESSITALSGLIGGTRLIRPHFLHAIPRSRQAICFLTALYRDTALLRQPSQYGDGVV